MMETKDYRCEDCDYLFELPEITSDSPQSCPNCTGTLMPYESPFPEDWESIFEMEEVMEESP